MEAQIIINRIARIERLAKIARDCNYIDKCYQAYRLRSEACKRLNELLTPKFI